MAGPNAWKRRVFNSVSALYQMQLHVQGNELGIFVAGPLRRVGPMSSDFVVRFYIYTSSTNIKCIEFRGVLQKGIS